LPHVLGNCATQNKGKKNYLLVLEKKAECLARSIQGLFWFWSYLSQAGRTDTSFSNTPAFGTRAPSGLA